MMNKRYAIISCLPLFLVCQLAGCTHKTTKIPDTGNVVLDSLLHLAPITTIDIDHFPVDTVVAKPENVMGRKSGPRIAMSNPLGRIKGLIKIGDTLYIGDQQRNCIWAMDNRGTWIRKIGRKGKGPGEFEDLYSIVHNSSNIFSIDVNNARIQVYDKHFALKTFFYKEIFGWGIGDSKIAITNSHIYLPVDVGQSRNNLIEIRESTSPFDSVGTFWPRIIPFPEQPLAYDSCYLNANSQNELAIIYNGLPYIFILNQAHKIIHIIYVKSAAYKNPSPKPVNKGHKAKTTMADVIGIHGFINNIFLGNHGSLYFIIMKDFFELKFDRKEEIYHLKKITYFTFGNSPLGKNAQYDIGAVSAMTIDMDTLYFGSIWNQYIFRFALK